MNKEAKGAKIDKAPQSVKKEKYLTIENVVAGNSEKVIIGTFDKANNAPAQNHFEAEVKPGSYSIPSQSLVWAKRGKDGELDFSKKWGEGDGYEAVEIRYSKKCRSLDKQFQIKTNIFDPKNIVPEELYIQITSELTSVDYAVDPMLAKFLEHASMNGSSICRNPEAEIIYNTYDAEVKTKTILDDFEIETKAMVIVKEAKSDEEKAIVLASIFGIDSQLAHEQIVQFLIVKAKTNPVTFIGLIESSVNDTRSIINDSIKLGLLDLTSPSLIKLKSDTDSTYDVIMESTDLPVTDLEKIEYLVTNIFNVEVYDIILKIKEKNFKELNKNL